MDQDSHGQIAMESES